MGMSVFQTCSPVCWFSATTEVFVPTKIMPLNAERKVCMPETLAFQRILEVSGAGPFEKRVKAESPMNWGHSYCSRFELEPDVAVMLCPLVCMVNVEVTAEMSSNARIIVTLLLVRRPLPPKWINARVCSTINFAENPKSEAKVRIVGKTRVLLHNKKYLKINAIVVSQ